MDNLKLFNGVIGKVLTEANTDEDFESELDFIMNKTVDELPTFVNEFIGSLPAGIRKLKVSTVYDIFLNIANEETLAELEELIGEEEKED